VITIMSVPNTGSIVVRDCNFGVPAIFANPKSLDWQCPIPGISGLQKLAKIVHFCVLNDTIKNCSRLMNKIFHVR